MSQEEITNMLNNKYELEQTETKPKDHPDEMVMCIPNRGSMNIGNVLENSLLAGGTYVHDITRLKAYLHDLKETEISDQPITYSYLEAFCNEVVNDLPVVYLPRDYAETRDDMKQIVVGAFIHSDSKILLIHLYYPGQNRNLSSYKCTYKNYLNIHNKLI
jgi:hypothetical protein